MPVIQLPQHYSFTLRGLNHCLHCNFNELQNLKCLSGWKCNLPYHRLRLTNTLQLPSGQPCCLHRPWSWTTAQHRCSSYFRYQRRRHRKRIKTEEALRRTLEAERQESIQRNYRVRQTRAADMIVLVEPIPYDKNRQGLKELRQTQPLQDLQCSPAAIYNRIYGMELSADSSHLDSRRLG